jgi:hypothetical protein
MLAFACPVCARLVTFESFRCLNCGTDLGFNYSTLAIEAVASPDSSGSAAGSVRCANLGVAACNWLTSAAGELCPSCLLTRKRPSDDDLPGFAGFAVAEGAKRRLLFELASLGLPVAGHQERDGGLAFEFLSSEREPVTTGHGDGVITLDLDEADPAHRERMRVRLGEPYRTVLGHLRHEIGHYYQPILVPPGVETEARCRELFGDEREDYQRALDRYYADGAPSGWEQSFVSAYATMHPWEDWAETFAHYLHIRDTLQTAAAYGVRIDGPSIATADPSPLYSDPDEATPDTRALLNAWLPMTYALNAISRSMGALDLYPFVLTPRIESKLTFIDGLVRACEGASVTARTATRSG